MDSQTLHEIAAAIRRADGNHEKEVDALVTALGAAGYALVKLPDTESGADTYEQAQTRLFEAVDRYRASDEADYPHSHPWETEYAAELVALAARDLTAVVHRMRDDQKPVGWDS